MKHGFVSAKSDGGDATLVRPSNWNAAHTWEATEDASSVLKMKRYSAKNGTALVAGDFALSAGWGNTAAVSAVIGTDQAWEITVTCGGTGIAANPTIALTYKDGTWTSSPITITKQVDGTGVFADIKESATATVLTLTWKGTPVSGSTYVINGLTMGRA